jgi:hypothetical protein
MCVCVCVCLVYGAGAPVFHVVSSIAHHTFFAPHSLGLPTLFQMCVTTPPDFSFFEVNNSLFWSWYFGLCAALLVLAVVTRAVFGRGKGKAHPKVRILRIGLGDGLVIVVWSFVVSDLICIVFCSAAPNRKRTSH